MLKSNHERAYGTDEHPAAIGQRIDVLKGAPCFPQPRCRSRFPGDDGRRRGSAIWSFFLGGPIRGWASLGRAAALRILPLRLLACSAGRCSFVVQSLSCENHHRSPDTVEDVVTNMATILPGSSMYQLTSRSC